MKKILWILIVLIIFGISLFIFTKPAKAPEVAAPEIKAVYKNASTDLIVVDLPYPGAVVGKNFSITGKARGSWYFEASFPYVVLDKNGKALAGGPVQANGDWMTTEFVPFKVGVQVSANYIGPATIVLKNDNPSGLAANEKSVSFPINIEY